MDGLQAVLRTWHLRPNLCVNALIFTVLVEKFYLNFKVISFVFNHKLNESTFNFKFLAFSIYDYSYMFLQKHNACTVWSQSGLAPSGRDCFCDRKIVSLTNAAPRGLALPYTSVR